MMIVCRNSARAAKTWKTNLPPPWWCRLPHVVAVAAPPGAEELLKGRKLPDTLAGRAVAQRQGRRGIAGVVELTDGRAKRTRDRFLR